MSPKRGKIAECRIWIAECGTGYKKCRNAESRRQKAEKTIDNDHL